MSGSTHSSRKIYFGEFELNVDTAELRNNGSRVILPGQPFQVLLTLLDAPGQLVTREELKKRLWPSDTFVDFDQSLNKAVNRLREALGDSAEQPRFIETLPRRGYRFVGPVGRNDQKDQVGKSKPRKFAFVPVTIASTIILAFCLVAAPWAYVRWRSRNIGAPVFRPVPLTALPGDATVPSLSPDGSQVAFSWTGDIDKTKGVDLYIKKVRSEDVLRLTHHGFDFVTSAWSPDGTQVAFQGSSKSDSGLYIVKTDATGEKKLRSTFPNSGALSNLAWSPDGKTIAFVDAPIAGGRESLELLSVETLQVSQIERDDKCLYQSMPAFSHDGKQLAYACYLASGKFALSIAGALGQSPRKIREFDGYTLGTTWAPDDRRLIFSHFQQGYENDRLNEMTITDGSVRDLQFGAGAPRHDLPIGRDALWPNVALSAKRFAFALEEAGFNMTIWRADLRHPHSPPIKLIASSRRQVSPQYSSDGKHIAFSSNRSGRNELWISDPDGKNLVQLSHSEVSGLGNPSWSPDSRRIVFDGLVNAHSALYIADIDERIPRKLNIGSNEGSFPSWSHDGKWIYFTAASGPRGGPIYRVSPEGGEPQLISSVLGYAPKDSFDEKGVYFVAMPKTLEFATINPTGTEFNSEGMPPLAFHGNWTVVRDGVYFFPEDAPKTLNYFDFATKHVHPVLTVKRTAPFGLSVSPDERYLLFTQLEDLHSDIMMVDDFK